MAIDEIGGLHERIIQLDEYSKSLRRESNEIVAFIPGEDGMPQQLVTDPARFAEIGEELRDAVTARAHAVGKLVAVEALLGHNEDGSLAALSGEGYINQATKLRFEHANKMHVLMCNYRRALIPSELEALPEYQKLKAATLPKIAELEEKAAQDQQHAAQVWTILNGK
jgi:hypothetical protein